MSQNRSTYHLRYIFCEAYRWLGKRRKNHPCASDIWDFRRSWNVTADSLINVFQRGTYRFSIQQKISLSGGETIALWSSQDALVIKVLTCFVQELLSSFFRKSCYHLKGHGGLKGAVRDATTHLTDYRFFCKTDVKSYYASIEHCILLSRLHDAIGDRKLIGYIWQFLNRCVEWGGLYQDITKGIPRGSSLSPLLGAFYLLDLDQRMTEMEVKYFRYMDDILILAPTRWKLRKAIRILNKVFNELRLEKHPDKTLIGRTERGFDFLGYHFKPQRLILAQKTITNFIENGLRLYEQEPPHGNMKRLGDYKQRWQRWVKSGGTRVSKSEIDFATQPLADLLTPKPPLEAYTSYQAGGH